MVEVSAMNPIRGAASSDSGSLQTNRLASLRLIERCANILISGEIADAGYTVAEELNVQVKKPVKCALQPPSYPLMSLI